MGRRQFFTHERLAPVVLDRATLSRLLGRTVGFSLMLAASTAAGQTAPPTAGQATEKREDVALPGVDVEGKRAGEYLIPQVDLRKFPELNVMDIPQSISIIPQELMRQQAQFTLRDALRNVTGISLAAGEGGFQGDNLTLRGFPARNDIFLDGVRDFGSYTRDVFNLEAVEVLKGPSSVMFGRGSTGGIINQVSKLPGLAPFYIASATAGNGPFVRFTADLNQPFAEFLPGSAARMNVMVEKADIVGRDEVDVRRWGVAPSIGFGLNGPTKVVFSFFTQQEHNTPDDGIPYLFGQPAPVDRSNFYGLAEKDFEDTQVYIGTARIEHALNEAITLRGLFRYAWYGREAAPTAPRIAGVVTPATPLSTVLVNRGHPARDSAESIVSGQADMLAKFTTWGMRHAVVAGLELGHEIFDISRFAWANVPQASLLNPNPFQSAPNITVTRTSRVESHGTSFAAYALDEITITEQWKVLGGLRWDLFDASQRNDTTGVLLEANDKVPSPRAAVVYQPTRQQSYYLSYGTSFNPSSEGLTLAANNVDTPPELNRVFELGGKWNLFQDKLAVRGALFWIQKFDARTADPDSGLFTLDGKQRSRGFEVEVVGQPIRGWSILAGYTYLDTRVVESSDVQAGVAVQGKRLPNVPQNSGTLWTTYDIPPDWLWGQRFQVGGGVSGLSKRNANQNGTIEVPGYVRGDATVAWWPIPKLELRLNVTNLADNQYYDQVYTGHVVPAAGRTFLVTGTYSF